MQFDYFLANLLFGLTIFTAFMSLAHSLGDLLCRRFERDGRTAARLRGLTLILCGLTALMVFLYKLGEDKRETIDETAESKMQMYLNAEGASVGRLEARSFPRIDETNSVTLTQLPTSEASSEEKTLGALLRTLPTFQSLLSTNSSELCKGWIEQVEKFGIKVFRGTSFPVPGTRNTVVLCASDTEFSRFLPGIKPYLEGGGTVLVVGGVKGTEAQALFSELLGVKSWVRPSGPPPTYVTFGGELFSWGGLPSGLRLGLGPDWQSEEGGLLATLSPKQLADVRGTEADTAALVSRTHSAGTLMWTSLPAKYSLRLNALFNPYWKLVAGRMLARLTGLPLVGVRSLPGGAEKLAIPMVIGNFDARSAGELGSVLSKLGIRGSFYLSLLDANVDAKVTGVARDLLKSGHQVGAIDYSSLAKARSEYFAELGLYFNWREAFRRLSLEGNAVGESQECCRMGALFDPGTSAHTFAAAKMVGFDHIAGFPYQDWITPIHLGIAPTRVIQETLLAESAPHSMSRAGAVGGKADVRAAKPIEALAVLPMFSGADFQLLKDGKGIALGDLQAWMNNVVNDASWMGGPASLPLHSHIVSMSGLENLENALRSQQESGVKFLSVAAYLEWWLAKSQVEWTLEAASEKRVIFTVKNLSARNVNDVSLVELGSGWKRTQGQVLSLNAGDSARIIFERQL